MELPYDPEYGIYNSRLTPEKLTTATDDEMYWAARTNVIFRHTGELPIEISGFDAENLLNHVFTRSVSKVNPGRCCYQFACYHNGGMITDGVLLRLSKDRFWMVQADGNLFSWYKAHANGLDVKITDPNVWVSQIQGPNSMKFLASLIDDKLPEPWNYFDMGKVIIAGEEVIISRTGFSNELGWEIYLTPENDTLKIGKKLWEIGKNFDLRLTGTPVFRARRIEAGILSWGVEMSQEENPYEVNLGRLVEFNDHGKFIGRDTALKYSKRDQVKGLVGLKMMPPAIESNEKPWLIFNGENVIGKLTSVAYSPRLKFNIGLGLVCKQFTKLGTKLLVQGCDENYDAEVVPIPFLEKRQMSNAKESALEFNQLNKERGN